MHREGLDPVIPEQLLLPSVDVPQTDVDQLLCADQLVALQPAKDVFEIPLRDAGQECHGHAMDVTAGRAFGRVDVRVRVHPYYGYLPSEPLPDSLGDAGDGADGDRVVAAESDDQSALDGVFVDLCVQGLGDGTDGSGFFHVAVVRVFCRQ